MRYNVTQANNLVDVGDLEERNESHAFALVRSCDSGSSRR